MIGGAIIVGAQVGPEAAASNLGAWAKLFGIDRWPSWLTDHRVTVGVAVVTLGYYVRLYYQRRTAKTEAEAAPKPERADSIHPTIPSSVPPTRLTVRRHLPDDGRIFLHQTPLELFALFDGLTAYAATTRAQDFIDKWLPVSGPVSEVTPFAGGVWVHVRLRPNGWGPTVLMGFNGTEAQRVAHLEIGAIVEADGKFRAVNSLGITLDDCRLISVHPRA